MAKSKTKNKKTAKKNKLKILVTGGLGLIGHNVIKILQQDKHDVQAIDALTSYGSVAVPELEYLYNERLKQINESTQIYKEDICVPEIDEVFLKFKPDVIIHCASFPREAAVRANPVEAARTMCVGTANILDCCTRHNTKQFVYISSSMVYGDFEHALEEDRLNPSGQYSIWKIAGEELVHHYTETTKQNAVILRPTAVYGALDISDRVVGTFFRRALADEVLYVNGEEETLDFTYVTDTAKGIAQAATTNGVSGIFNISKQEKVTIKSVAERVVALVGKGTVKVRDKKAGMPSRGTLDCTKAREAFKFDPKITIDKGLELYYNSLKQKA
jgi:nucleoside-diphosphate-sugar epimerase